jgi:hypothetical protein
MNASKLRVWSVCFEISTKLTPLEPKILDIMSFGSRLEFMGKGSPLLARLLKRGRVSPKPTLSNNFESGQSPKGALTPLNTPFEE